MIVPNKTYTETVHFDPARNRWFVKFESVSPPGISMDFPLPDDAESGSRSLGFDEEVLLALTFNQMVQNAIESLTREAAKQQIAGPESASEVVLTD